MPKQNEPTTKFKVDISELKKGIQDAQRQIRLANAEFKAASSGMEDWANSSDGLTAKLNQLKTTMSAQEKILNSLEQQYEAVKEEQGENSKGAEELKIKIENQKAAINNTQKAIDQYDQSLDYLVNGLDESGNAADDAAKGLDEVGDAAKETEKDSDGLKTKLADLAKSGLKAVATAAAGFVTGFLASAESTREFREAMGKVNTAFTTAGFSAETGKKTFEDFAAILGDTDQATEAVGNLAKLCDSEKELSEWTKIATGVYGTFGDGLPIEGLAEAANETAKVAQITGPLADAINWATTDTEEWNKALSSNETALAAFQKGIAEGENAEDSFNLALQACNDEQERSQLITATLSSLYGDAAKAYEDTAGDIMDANRAQTQLNEAMAEVGKVAEPVMTTLKTMGAEILTSILPSVQDLGDGFRDMLNGVEGAGDKVGEAMSGIITALLDKVVELAPTVLEVGISLVSNLIQGVLASLPEIARAAIALVSQLITALGTELPKIALAIVEVVPQIINVLMAQLPQFITACVTFLMGIVQALPQVISAIIAALPQLINAIVYGLINGTQTLIYGAIQLFSAIVQALPQIITTLTEALPQLITTIVQALVDGLPRLLEAAIQLFMVIVQALPTVLPQIISMIPQIVIAIVDALIANLPLLTQCAITLFMTLVEAIPQIIVELAKAIPGIITAIITGLLQLIPKLLELGVTILTNLTTYWATIITMAQEKSKEFIKKIIDFLKQLPGKMWNILTQVIKKVVTWGVNLVTTGKQKASAFITAVIGFIKTLPGKIAEWLTTAVGKVVSWGSDMVAKGKQAAADFISNTITKIKELPGKLKEKLDNAIDKVKEFAGNMKNKALEAGKNMVDGVIEKIKSLPGDVKNIAGNIVTGLWNGMKEKTQWLKDKIKGWVGDVLKFIKGLFGIKSPSRVMRDQVGRYLAEGIAVGIEQNKGSVTKAFDDVKSDLTAPIGLNVNGAKSRIVTGSSVGSQLTGGNQPSNTNYTFNQYNTSPKALSRLEIYRQTRNQLQFAKGV